ncbi:hypothetical protein GCM10009081_11130 [Brevundimonas nasdae]
MLERQTNPIDRPWAQALACTIDANSRARSVADPLKAMETSFENPLTWMSSSSASSTGVTGADTPSRAPRARRRRRSFLLGFTGGRPALLATSSQLPQAGNGARALESSDKEAR